MARWLENQGVSTVLLCMIVGGIFYFLPGLITSSIDKIDEGYERNAQQLQRAFDTSAKSQDRMMQFLERREFGESAEPRPARVVPE